MLRRGKVNYSSETLKKFDDFMRKRTEKKKLVIGDFEVRKVNLLLASYLFYAAWNPPFVILLWISTVVDWYAGLVALWLWSRGHKRWVALFVCAIAARPASTSRRRSSC